MHPFNLLAPCTVQQQGHTFKLPLHKAAAPGAGDCHTLLLLLLPTP
jgi:hypothetical protein